MRYRILASLNSDSKQGFVWITDSTKELGNDFIQITNPENKTKIITSIRSIDDNFISVYNTNKRTINIRSYEPTLIINEYYRNKLGVRSKEYKNLIVEKVDHFGGLLTSTFYNPDQFKRVPLIMVLISLTFGFLLFLINYFRP